MGTPTKAMGWAQTGDGITRNGNEKKKEVIKYDNEVRFPA